MSISVDIQKTYFEDIFEPLSVIFEELRKM